ncbi:protease complex subunit PrcB family protein [Flavobacterium sp. 5]|uniref:protease complex subunit PrcB family protein n=1 Tax=Flavobacterium sp. 5 TaxID=2035199 RepID=UPI000C2CE24D|nr:protease complex subunit PrcB family protein [Flavobacterium sp. 5]PKB15178.1 hypothetical protein CLU82_0241 [Flavobacterium sp. 5]
MKAKIFTLLFISTIALFISCNNDDNSDIQSTEVNFTEIGKGALFGDGQEGISQSNLTITNTNDWKKLIAKMNSVNNVSNNFTETEINFNKFTIIAIFLEIKGGGWEIVTENVSENHNTISISTLETPFFTSVITQPFSIIKIPKTNKKIIVK